MTQCGNVEITLTMTRMKQIPKQRRQKRKVKGTKQQGAMVPVMMTSAQPN